MGEFGFQSPVIMRRKVLDNLQKNRNVQTSLCQHNSCDIPAASLLCESETTDEEVHGLLYDRFVPSGCRFHLIKGQVLTGLFFFRELPQKTLGRQNRSADTITQHLEWNLWVSTSE